MAQNVLVAPDGVTVTIEGQIQPPGMRQKPGGHGNQLPHHHVAASLLHLLPMGRAVHHIVRCCATNSGNHET
jgi:hypothetical protein